MWLYLAIYFVGVLLGVAANVFLDVRLHQPALSQLIVLTALGGVAGVVIFQLATSPEQWIMWGLWAVTGLLCGLGSRQAHEPIQ